MLSVIAGVGAFIPGLFGKQLSYKAAKLAGFATIAVAVIAALGIWLMIHDAGVIRSHELAEDKQIAEDTLDADRFADSEEDARKAAADAEDAVLADAMATAAAKDPEGAKKPVGPVTQSYYDNLPKKKGN